VTTFFLGPIYGGRGGKSVSRGLRNDSHAAAPRNIGVAGAATGRVPELIRLYVAMARFPLCLPPRLLERVLARYGIARQSRVSRPERERPLLRFPRPSDDDSEWRYSPTPTVECSGAGPNGCTGRNAPRSTASGAMRRVPFRHLCELRECDRNMVRYSLLVMLMR
jgi:hypothetical protein